MKIAFVSAVLALLVGYPMAYFIARSPEPWRSLLLMLVILPFWTSFLLRVYAWQGFLRSNGVINNFLLWIGIIDQPLVMLQTDFAVYVGIVYTYLPFMILPLYANLVKLDESLLEASADLGARPLATFFHVTLPLSMPGVIAGFMLVFIPAIGEFVIPELLGGPDTLMIGRVLWDEFFSNRDWPVASAVAIAMLVVLVVPIMLAAQRGAGGVQEATGRQPTGRRARRSAAAMLASTLLLICTVARLRVPLRADPVAGRLQLQREPAGDRLGRLLDQVVRRAVPRPADPRRGLAQPAGRGGERDARGGARHARGLRADPLRAVPRPGAADRHDRRRRW